MRTRLASDSERSVPVSAPSAGIKCVQKGVFPLLFSFLRAEEEKEDSNWFFLFLYFLETVNIKTAESI